MNYLKLLTLFCLFFCQQVFADTVNDRQTYINKYKRIAVLEMERTGIPASIKLAQGILESDGGNSFLAKEANNHFGIKCGPSWKGEKIFKKDDDRDRSGKLIESCFRVYSSSEESYVAHSHFLTDPNKRYRYGDLFKLKSDDYKGWARGLKRAGYATSSTYASKLIRIIETYELDKFDKMKGVDFPAPIEEEEEITDTNTTDTSTEDDDEPFFEEEPAEEEEDISYEIGSINDVMVAIALSGETPQEISDRTGIGIERILKFNEGLTKGNQKLKAGEKVYLEPKRNFYRGDKTFHRVKKGHTMYYIAQLYGVKLEKLYERNLMPPNSEPAIGEKVRVRGRTKKEADRPKLQVDKPKPPKEKPPVVVEDHEEDPFMGDPLEEEEEEKPLPDPPATETKPNTETTKPPSDPKPKPRPTPPTPPKIENADEKPPVKEEKEEEEEKPKVDPPKPTPTPTTETFHTVVSGDTLYSLSRRYNTTVDQIKKWNNLKDNTILPGQKLKVK